TQRRARVVVRLGAYVDETSRVADWHIPAAHYLESWGDARTSDGTLVAVQPLIRPLFGGLSDIEVLARFAGEPETQGYQIVRATFRALTNQTSEDAWERFLHEGFLAESARPPVQATVDGAALARAI